MTQKQRFVVTGAGGGIGRAICQQLAGPNCDLILVGTTEGSLDKTAEACEAKGSNVRCLVADLSTFEACQDVIKGVNTEAPVIDCLINVAGIMEFGLLENQSPEKISKLFDVNVLAVVYLTQAVIPYFKTVNRGHIINIGSTFGSIGFAGFSTYAASKFAVRGFTESIRRELNDTGINVSYIAPRATATPFNTSDIQNMNQALGTQVDEPEVIAEAVTKILNEKNADMYLGWPEKLFVKLNSLYPRVVDKALAKKLKTIKQYASN